MEYCQQLTPLTFTFFTYCSWVLKLLHHAMNDEVFQAQMSPDLQQLKLTV